MHKTLLNDHGISLQELLFFRDEHDHATDCLKRVTSPPNQQKTVISQPPTAILDISGQDIQRRTRGKPPQIPLASKPPTTLPNLRLI